jgi:hypothetical protein
MKTENSRLGRCSSCRYWKSATDLLAERTNSKSPPDEIDAVRRAIRQELTQDILSADQADYRGWCQAAETGLSEPGQILAVNLLNQESARMISAHDYGCLNYHPRPRRAMNAPPPDFSKNPRLGRCGGCRFWSGAENEAQALLSMARYNDPNARMEDAEREAYARLSPPPFDINTAGRRGWCKISSDYTQTNAKNLAVDPSTGAVGAVITSDDYACTRHIEARDPRMRTSPDWRWMVDRTRLYNLGPSAPINELLWSYLDPATLMDPNHPLSPLHEEHPLNIRNPRSLYYNPNPAFAAYVTNPSMVRTVVETKGLQLDAVNEHSEGPSETTKLRLSLPFNASPGTNSEVMTKQLMAQARLAQDFAAKTLKGGAADLTTGPAVSLSKKTDKPEFERRQRPKSNKFVKTPTPGGFVDRRKT